MDDNLFVTKHNKEQFGMEKWDDALLTKNERTLLKKEIPQAPEVHLNEEDSVNSYRKAYAERLKVTSALMPNKFMGGDHAEMKAVKRTLNEINGILGSEIPADRNEYDTTIRSLSEKYKELIKACEVYENEHDGVIFTPRQMRR